MKRQLHLYEKVFNDDGSFQCLVKDHPQKELLTDGGVCDGDDKYCGWAKKQKKKI